MNPPPMEETGEPARRGPVQADAGGPGLRRGLVALATAAVVTAYAAGYVRTRDAAESLAGGEGRRGAPGSLASGAVEDPPALVSSAPPVAAPAAPLPSAPAPAQDPIPTAPAPDPGPATAPAIAPPDAQPVQAAGEAPASATAAGAPSAYKDGVYTGWGSSLHGRIEATVQVSDGRIVDAKISTCRMRWPCARIAFLVPQPAERQSAEVDVISRVTESSDAFYYALVEALSKAK